jgi:uncharacterized OB-fold protein
MTVEAVPRSLPVLKGSTAEFYGWCRQHELRFQRCARCKTWRHPPRLLCNHCHSFETEWAAVSGRATLHAWTVAVAAMGPAFANDVPYVAAIVQLEEGPRMASWVTGVAEDQLREGMGLQLWFDDVTPEVSLPKFKAAG